jgi:putative spermidine/putrescine transport system ATP-binding protein
MADRVGVMRAGRHEQCAAPAELYDRPATPFVAEFVGTMNHLSGTTEAGGRVRVGSQVLPTTGEQLAGSLVTVLVRPEAVVIEPDDRGDAVVVVANFRGATVRVRLLRSDGTELLADVPSHRAAEYGPGARVRVTLLDKPVLLA